VFEDKIICMKCQKKLATHKITQINKGEVTVLSLCQECAAEVSPYQKKWAQAQMDLSQILASILQGGKAKAEEAQAEAVGANVSCGTCGLPFQHYRKTLFLGCPDCYESFGKLMVAELRKFHGGTQHRGKVPVRLRRVLEQRRGLDDLRQRMNQAIEREEFETAARLRDQIRALQETMDAQ
jgi:protein arginine kinase activator